MVFKYHSAITPPKILYKVQKNIFTGEKTGRYLLNQVDKLKSNKVGYVNIMTT